MDVEAYAALKRRVEQAVADECEPSAHALQELCEFRSRVWFTNPNRNIACIFECCYRALLLHARAHKVEQVCTHPWAHYETDEYVEDDKDFTIFSNDLNKANLAYQVLFAEKLDKRFLQNASTWCACDAYRIQLRHQLESNSSWSSPRELTPRLCAWLEGRFQGDIFKERMTAASIESCTPAFLVVVVNSH